MNSNVRLFFAINRLVGKNRFLDAFGSAGAEWVIVAMVGWYGSSAAIAHFPDWRVLLKPAVITGAAWLIGWIVSQLIGLIVREHRPHVSYPETRILFTPMSNWKSFPSDHALSAWLIFFLALVFGLPAAWALLPMALWVSWGRVYAGLHYPFDIIGGASLAGLLAVAAQFILIKWF